MSLPQPVKGCLVTCMVLFAVAFASVPLMAFLNQVQTLNVMPWMMGALGLSAVALPVVLAFPAQVT